MICSPYKNAKLINITNYFGQHPEWYGGIPHTGCDWVSFYSCPLVAPEDCVVDNIITENNISNDLTPISRGYGIIMKGISGKFHLFWHCLPVFPVGLGQSIKQGGTVAFMGNSGFVLVGGQVVPIELRNKLPYSGTHLHQEIFTIKDGKRIYEDPLSLIDFSIPISYNLIESIQIVINKIKNLILNK